MSAIHFAAKLDRIVLDVVGSYQPFEPQTWDEPGCDENFYVEEVIAGGQNIMELMNDDALTKIAQQGLEYVRNKKESAAIDAAEYRRESFRDSMNNIVRGVF